MRGRHIRARRRPGAVRNSRSPPWCGIKRSVATPHKRTSVVFRYWSFGGNRDILLFLEKAECLYFVWRAREDSNLVAPGGIASYADIRIPR